MDITNVILSEKVLKEYIKYDIFFIKQKSIKIKNILLSLLADEI